MARYLIDEDLPRSLALSLRSRGLDAVDVRDAGLRGRPDVEVFSFAGAEGRVLVSGDLGFANVLQYPPGTHAGIVVARLPNTMPVDSVIAVLEEAVTELGNDAQGCLVIVEEGRVRLRRG